MGELVAVGRRGLRFALAWRPLEALVHRRAARAGKSLILVYHRIGPAQLEEIVPSVPAERFEFQLTTLAHLGHVLPLEQLLDFAPGHRPRFAITFDDDYRGHLAAALPIARKHGIEPTFFLNGREFFGDGPYWWQHLEAAIRRDGLAAVAEATNERGASTRFELAARLEVNGRGDELLRPFIDLPTDPLLDSAQLAQLARSARVGFHTRHHPLLVGRSNATVESALVEGCPELARHLQQPLDQLAYPHGKIDDAALAVVRQHGNLRHAFTGAARTCTRRSDPFQLARWDPSFITQGFRRELALRLFFRAL